MLLVNMTPTYEQRTELKCWLRRSSTRRNEALRAEIILWSAVGFETLSHHPIQRQRQKADPSTRTNALGQTVVDRRDLDVALQHVESTADVGQCLAAPNDMRSGKSGHTGEQRVFAVESLDMCDRFLRPPAI